MGLLYVWPGDIRNTNNYSFYYYFNGILLLDFIFKIPLSFFYIVGLIFFSNNNRKTAGWIGLILSGSLSLTMLYGILFGSEDIVVNKVELEYLTLPPQFNNYKIVHISDIHLGSFIHSKKLLERAQKKIENINPDLILFTGDLVNNFSDELKGWDTIFNKINSTGLSFSVLGNHDYGNYSNWKNESEKVENFNNLVKSHDKLGFQILRNENAVVYSGTDSIYIIGVENWGHPPFPQYAELEKALLGVPENVFKILLTHDPAHWESQIDGKKNIELTLSGHSHGLQLGIVKAGIPFSFSYLTRKNWGGLYKSNGVNLYVNTGLGTVGLPWRIDMPAEITVITLKKTFK
ncbi:MAG: metallophosphoesterase [Bacteroidales bacterium]|nr:metallophosphoesterase [Bacteroidales bacterium]